MISKQAKEAQLQQIFRMLVDSMTQEEIAKDLNISLRTVQRYTLEIDKRYGQTQLEKTDNTLFMECQLFKNRMLKLYKGLENVVNSPDKTVSGTERAKCAEVAANICIDVLKMESEGIRAVKELIGYGKGQSKLIESIQHRYNNRTDNNSESEQDRDINDNTSEQQSSTYSNNNNRKF